MSLAVLLVGINVVASTHMMQSPPPSSGRTALKADSAQLKYLGRVDLSDAATAKMTWTMTGAAATVVRQGQPIHATTPTDGDAYTCEKNENYEGETTASAMPAQK